MKAITKKIFNKNTLFINFDFRGFKTKRPNYESVSQAQQNSSTETDKVYTNTFANDGNFLEQFKKMKDNSKTESPQIKNPNLWSTQQQQQVQYAKPSATTSEVKPEVKPEVKTEAKTNEDWYQSALERAKNIAKAMTKDIKPELPGKYQIQGIPSQTG